MKEQKQNRLQLPATATAHLQLNKTNLKIRGVRAPKIASRPFHVLQTTTAQRSIAVGAVD